MKRKTVIVVVLALLLGVGGFALAQQMMGPGMMGQLGSQAQQQPQGMGPGWMGPGGPGMMGFGMMSSPEIMGTMMSLRGEMMSIMGNTMMESVGQLTPERRQEVRKEMLERMGESLIRHGTRLKEKAKVPAR